MKAESRKHARLSLAVVFNALAILAAAGCTDDVECGEGTVLFQGECVPLQAANCQGEGVRFIDGRCEPDFTTICGEGTVLSEDGTECIPGVPTADAGVDVDGGATDIQAIR